MGKGNKLRNKTNKSSGKSESKGDKTMRNGEKEHKTGGNITFFKVGMSDAGLKYEYVTGEIGGEQVEHAGILNHRFIEDGEVVRDIRKFVTRKERWCGEYGERRN